MTIGEIPQPAGQGPQERVEPSTPTSPPTTEAAPGAPCGPSGGLLILIPGSLCGGAADIRG